MLWINRKRPDGTYSTYKWEYLPDENTWKQLNGVPLGHYEEEFISSVEAIDKEVAAIYSNFGNLPMLLNNSNQRCHRWYGDHAKFIAAAIINWE